MPPISCPKFTLAAAALFSLASCASVNPVGLAKLAAMNPLTTEPSQLSVAARLPDSLKLRTGDLIMVIETEGAAGPDKIEETFLLEVKEAKAGDAGVIVPESGERLQTARVAIADLARLTAAQGKARALKAGGGTRGKGSISVAVQGGCKTGEPSAGPLMLNIFMETEKDGGWFPVVSDYDMRKSFGDDVIAKIVPCV
jgi:hypothetical protein